MRLSLEEKKYLFKILDHLTDRTGYYEVKDGECERMTYPLFKKFKMELLGV